MTNKKGFTLIEILVVITIIALMASAAVPTLLRARIASNQTAAVSTIRAFISACNLYQLKNDEFPLSEDLLATSDPPFISDKIVQAKTPQNALKGYYYVYDSPTSDEFTISGQPSRYGVTGLKSFIGDYQGVIHYTEEDRPATLEDTLIN